SESVDATALLASSLESAGLRDAVGLLTARDLSRHHDLTHERDGLFARCVVTAGLSNALAAGDPPAGPAVGTINMLCIVSCALTEEALVEASALATEAKTAALLDSNLKSPLSGRPITGTGTDCVVIAAPVEAAQRERFSGKHTRL